MMFPCSKGKKLFFFFPFGFFISVFVTMPDSLASSSPTLDALGVALLMNTPGQLSVVRSKLRSTPLFRLFCTPAEREKEVWRGKEREGAIASAIVVSTVDWMTDDSHLLFFLSSPLLT